MNRIFISFLLLFYASNSLATVNGFVMNATKNSTGVWTTVAGGVASNAFLTRSFQVSSLSANAALLRRMASPYGLALQAAAIAFGYLYANGTLSTPGGWNYSNNGKCVRNSTGNGTWTDTTPEQCLAWRKSVLAPTGSGEYMKVSSYGGVPYKYYDCIFPNGGPYGNYGDTGCYQLDSGGYQSYGSLVVLPGPLNESQKTAFREQQVAMSPKNIFENDNQIADRDVTEIRDQLDDMGDDWDAATDTNPDGTPDTTTNPTTDVATGDTGVDSYTPTKPQSDAPYTDPTVEIDECAEFPDRVGCQNLGDFPISDVITTVDVPIVFDVTSWGSGTCPDPETMELSFGNLSMSYQPICNFMTGMNPVVIASGFIIAGFIVFGSVKD